MTHYMGGFLMRTLRLAITLVFILALGLSLSACADKVTYTVYFDANGGTDTIPVTTSELSKISIPDNPTKVGHTFGGWFWDDDTFETPFTANSLMDAPLSTEMTVHAKWNPIFYSITYVLNGGINDSNNPTTFVITDEFTLNNPEKEGYTFDEWYLDIELTTPYSFTALSAENVTLYAKWIINQYSITFIENGASNIDNLVQNFGTDVDAPSELSRQGYTFGGWYTDTGFNELYIFTTIPAENVTLYAKWNPNLYELSFETFDGIPIESISFLYGHVLETTTPVYEGHDFMGWYLDADLLEPFEMNLMPYYDLTIYAKWRVAELPDPTEIVIMHSEPYTIDPFHVNYSGTEQLEKQLLQREVEERLNVTIVYRPYPISASWGPSRITAIIQSSLAGDPLADIYASVSDWTQQLVDGNAIVSIDPYLNINGQNISSSFLETGSYHGQHYGFETGNINVDIGLYFNENLINSLGVDNPTELYLDGLWTWSRFDTWATEVQTLLTAQANDMYALGGMLPLYAESMVPLNSGRLIDLNTGRVAFAQTPALETYAFLSSLYAKGLFELYPQYDAGSAQWLSGKVAMHPGSLWFVNAPNRWGGLAFELGFVPYPKSNSYTGDYVSPVSGVALYHLASGVTPEKEALAFQVWNELQLWKTEVQLKDSFELSLSTKLDDLIYIEAYLEIYDKTYLELCNAIGISTYGENGWRRNINISIKNGTSGILMDQIKPVYEAALEAYLSE